MGSESSGSVLPKILAGCVLFVGLLVGGAVLVVIGTVVGQNLVVGSAPTEIDSTFEGTLSADGRYGTLSGEGAVVFQEFVAERSAASVNPFRIAAFNFDYHVVGTYGYSLRISVNPADRYSPNYTLTQSGRGFVWREDGAAFAQVRSADFTVEELITALEPFTQFEE